MTLQQWKKLQVQSSNCLIGIAKPTEPIIYDSNGLHPSKCLHKKFTTFYGDVCYVRFDRKTLPKSGKSILNNCFIEKKNTVWLIWDIKTRALLGIGNDKNLVCKTLEYSKRFNNDSN